MKVRRLTLNPFVSEEQRRACYAADDPDWDCDEWQKKTPKKLPKRKRPTANVNPLRIDPTRTTSLRRKITAEMRRRFALLKGRIVKLVVDEDAFGLKDSKHSIFTANTRWRFASDPEKIKAFQSWLKTQVKQTLTDDKTEELWKRYIEEGFRKGAGRSFDDVKKPGKHLADQRKMDFYAGTREQFLRSSFAQPVAVEKVKLLAGRAFDELDGITSDMGLKMSRALTDGLVQGKGPRDIARDLNDEVDIGSNRAEVVARSELIRSHADGQLMALEQLGVEEVGVAVEWMTAGDEKVCPECEDLEGVVLKIEEAQGMLPRHPNCFLHPNVPVTTLTGDYALESIKVGDLVLTHLGRFRKVAQAHRNAAVDVDAIELTLRRKLSGKNWSGTDHIDFALYAITADHPVLLNGKWTPAKDLKIGDMLEEYRADKLTADRLTIAVIKSLVVPQATLYNLSVEEDESYVAYGIAVHNCRCAWAPANVGEDDEDQKDTKASIDKAVRASVGKGSDDWEGPEVSQDRPQSILNEDLVEFSRALRNERGEGGTFFARCVRDELGHCLPEGDIAVAPAELKQAQSLARRKAAETPTPTSQDVKAANQRIDELGADKYESQIRGNTSDRAASRQRLLKEFGDGKKCPCVYCGRRLNDGTVTRDKIKTARQGGRYRNDNLVPACISCNKSRGDVPWEKIRWK